MNLFCNTNNFEQLIGEPTRITEMSCSVLDQVVTNIGHFVKEARVDPPVSSSDHCTVSLDLLFRLKKQKAYTRRVWEFANARFDNYRNSLSTMSLAECIDVNIEESCDRLTKSLLDAAHQCIPSKIVTIRPNDKPWFNNSLRRLMLCSTLLPYQNVLTDPLMRCPIALYPSTFDLPSSPSPTTQQASRAHDKRDLYNTCIVSKLSRNKYCLNQVTLALPLPLHLPWPYSKEAEPMTSEICINTCIIVSQLSENKYC